MMWFGIQSPNFHGSSPGMRSQSTPTMPFGPPVRSVGWSRPGKWMRSRLSIIVTKSCPKKSVTIAK